MGHRPAVVEPSRLSPPPRIERWHNSSAGPAARPPSSPSTPPPASWSAPSRRSAPDEVQAVVDDVARIQPAWAELSLKARAALHAPRRRRTARRHRRDRRAAGQRAGQAARRGLHDGAAADGRRAALVRQGRPEDPRRREGADDPGLLAEQEKPLHLRADRRSRRHRPLELPLVDPLRRGRDRADGGQRRRPQAGQPHAPARRGDPSRLREGRPARGTDPRRPRRRRGRRRAGQLERRQGLLHRLGRGRPQGRRGLRPAASRARCWSSAARTR